MAKDKRVTSGLSARCAKYDHNHCSGVRKSKVTQSFVVCQCPCHKTLVESVKPNPIICKTSSKPLLSTLQQRVLQHLQQNPKVVPAWWEHKHTITSGELQRMGLVEIQPATISIAVMALTQAGWNLLKEIT